MAKNLIFIVQRDMKLRNYSQKTIDAYIRVIQEIFIDDRYIYHENMLT